MNSVILGRERQRQLDKLAMQKNVEMLLVALKTVATLANLF